MYTVADSWYNSVVGVNVDWLPATKQYRVVLPKGVVLVYDSIVEVLALCEKHGFRLKLKEGMR